METIVWTEIVLESTFLGVIGTVTFWWFKMNLQRILILVTNRYTIGKNRSTSTAWWFLVPMAFRKPSFTETMQLSQMLALVPESMQCFSMKRIQCYKNRQQHFSLLLTSTVCIKLPFLFRQSCKSEFESLGLDTHKSTISESSCVSST